uniref:Uncharacterized protein n=1 Tax=Alexandrium monilatum TaxID=311494 RepID=A0A7S4UK33_9DINO
MLKVGEQSGPARRCTASSSQLRDSPRKELLAVREPFSPAAGFTLEDLLKVGEQSGPARRCTASSSQLRDSPRKALRCPDSARTCGGWRPWQRPLPRLETFIGEDIPAFPFNGRTAM